MIHTKIVSCANQPPKALSRFGMQLDIKKKRRPQVLLSHHIVRGGPSSVPVVACKCHKAIFNLASPKIMTPARGSAIPG